MRGRQSAGMRAARAVDTLVTCGIALILLAILAVAGYSLKDSYDVLEGTTAADEMTFSELLALYPDVCAWLTIDNTNIDYVVTQGEDNFEYLTQDATGEYTASGSIFLDSECSRDFTEPYEVIMGHHMASSKMFGDLDLFLDEDFFSENQTGTLYLPTRTLSLQVCAVLTADAYDGVLYGTPVTTTDGLSRVIDRVNELALYQRDGVELTESDQLIALSTCASSGVNDRTILICRVTGETEASYETEATDQVEAATE